MAHDQKENLILALSCSNCEESTTTSDIRPGTGHVVVNDLRI